MNKNYYLILDTETATLPFVDSICKTAKQKQTIAIAKPLVYDIGWVIIDRKGNEIKRANYLVQETFFVPNIFNTAYYKNKRPLYMDKLKKGEIGVKKWWDIKSELIEDFDNVTIATAYNACFDFKKAIPFTDNYIYHLYSYSDDYNQWEKKQYEKCLQILDGTNQEKNDNYLADYIVLRKQKYAICDLWGYSCRYLLNNRKYKEYCLQNNRISNSGLYFSTNAETAFQYLMKEYEFKEEHTALSDAIIESQILTKVLKKCGVRPQIDPFPFRMLGNTIDYVIKERRKTEYAEILIQMIENWQSSHESSTAYWNCMENRKNALSNLIKRSKKK